MQHSDTRRAEGHASLIEYFQHRLEALIQELEPPPQDDTCWYLGSMLERFSRSEALFAWEAGQYSLRPLALLYGDAHAARNQHERCLILQHLGDTALFLGALFPKRYSRRGIGVDYFVGMGGGAYDYLAHHARHGRHVFGELAESFSSMLDLVARTCAEDASRDNHDVVRLYQIWLDQGDAESARALLKLGIDVNGAKH